MLIIRVRSTYLRVRSTVSLPFAPGLKGFGVELVKKNNSNISWKQTVKFTPAKKVPVKVYSFVLALLASLSGMNLWIAPAAIPPSLIWVKTFVGPQRTILCRKKL